MLSKMCTAKKASKKSKRSPISRIDIGENWRRIYRQLVTYLNERHIDTVETNIRSTAEKRLHSILVSTGGKEGTGKNIELELLFKLLNLLKMGGYEKIGHNPVIHTDQKVMLLKLIIWVLCQWKTLEFVSLLEQRRYAGLFERCFFRLLQQIRVDSALSLKVGSSTKGLELIDIMNTIRELWITHNLASRKMTNKYMVDAMEVAVMRDVEEKIRISLRTCSKESFPFLTKFEERREQLLRHCQDGDNSRESMSKRGMVVKEMVEFFVQSAKVDPSHRDHVFIQGLLYKTTSANHKYKRALVWIMLFILPHLTEKSGPVRLIHLTQGLMKQALNLATKTNLKEEVSAWIKILRSTLSPDDILYFYSVVSPMDRLDQRFGFTDKGFEDFYPFIIINKDYAQDCEVGPISSMVPDDSVDPWEIKETVDWDVGMVDDC